MKTSRGHENALPYVREELITDNNKVQFAFPGISLRELFALSMFHTLMLRPAPASRDIDRVIALAVDAADELLNRLED